MDSSINFCIEKQTLSVSFDTESDYVTPENLYCALFVTKDGRFLPITKCDELMTLYSTNVTNFTLQNLPVGKEINAIINDIPSKIKLIKLFSSQIGMLQFIAAYGSTCINEYVNLSSFLLMLLKQTSNSSSFVNEAKLCISGLNQKINSMEDTIGLYKKELESVKTDLNEHLVQCTSYNSCVNAVATELPQNEFQFVAFPPNEKLTWMGIDVRNKVMDLFNRLINQVEDFPTELALNMWGIRVLIGNDISTKTIQFRQDPPLILKDPTGYELYTRILFRWHCSEAIVNGKVVVEDYCRNREHWDSMLSDSFFNEELPHVLKNVREKTDRYEKIKKDSNYNPLYYQMISNRGKPTPEWTVSHEALAVAYRLGYDDSFEVQSPMLRLIRMYEEGKTTSSDYKNLCRILHCPEPPFSSAAASEVQTVIAARGRGRPPKLSNVVNDDEDEGKSATSNFKKIKLNSSIKR